MTNVSDSRTVAIALNKLDTTLLGLAAATNKKQSVAASNSSAPSDNALCSQQHHSQNQWKVSTENVDMVGGAKFPQAW